MNETIAIIQARMGSSRLPAKLLAPIGGVPLLEMLWRRVERAARVDDWWLATTVEDEDDETEAWGRRLGLRVERGDREDVLSRFAAIVRRERPRLVVRMTADNPLVHADAVDELVSQARDRLAPEAAHVIGDRDPRRLPLGFLPEVVTGDAVVDADETLPATTFHRSHVTSRAWSTAGSAFEPPASWPQRPAWRWTVDTADDLDMMNALAARVGDRWSTIDYAGLVAIVDAEPAISLRNAHVAQKADREG